MSQRGWILYLFAILLGITLGGYVLLNNKTDQTNGLPATKDRSDEAIRILETIPEIKIIQDAVLKAGRKPYFVVEEENGDIVTVSLKENWAIDFQISRIDTFKINVVSKEIIVLDFVNNTEVSLEEWKKTVKERF